VEVDVTFQWYRSNDNGVTFEAIVGATNIDYTLTTVDEEKYLKLGVIPYSDITGTPTHGIETMSLSVGPIDEGFAILDYLVDGVAPVDGSDGESYDAGDIWTYGDETIEGEGRKRWSFKLSNSGELNDITAIEMSIDEDVNFTLNKASLSDIAPGTSRNFTLTFDPVTHGVHYTTLVIKTGEFKNIIMYFSGNAKYVVTTFRVYYNKYVSDGNLTIRGNWPDDFDFSVAGEISLTRRDQTYRNLTGYYYDDINYNIYNDIALQSRSDIDYNFDPYVYEASTDKIPGNSYQCKVYSYNTYTYQLPQGDQDWQKTVFVGGSGDTSSPDGRKLGSSNDDIDDASKNLTTNNIVDILIGPSQTDDDFE